MTKGKLINKTTGDTLTVETNKGHIQAADVFIVNVVGDTRFNVRHFSKREWDFIEDKPTAYEVIKAMKPGTVFAGAGVGATRYIRLDEDYYYSTFSNAVSQLTEHSFGSRFEAHEVEL